MASVRGVCISREHLALWLVYVMYMYVQVGGTFAGLRPRGITASVTVAQSPALTSLAFLDDTAVRLSRLERSSSLILLFSVFLSLRMLCL